MASGAGRVNYTVKVNVDQAAVQANLGRMSARARNFMSVFRWARDELRKANAANFASNGLPAGGWAPLDAEYAAWKAVNFPGAPPMQRGGRLLRDLTTLSGSGNRIGLTSAEFGTTVEYAKFHQYGTTKMPARKVVFSPPGFAAELGQHAASHIVGRNLPDLMFEGGL